MNALLERLPSLDEIRAERVRREALRLDPLAWTLKHRPKIHGQALIIPAPLGAIYQDRSREVVVAKAAQVMISEWAVNLAFWCADTRVGGRGNALYIFPSKENLGDFVRARIDTAIEESEYLSERVRPVRGFEVETPASKPADNVGLKRVGKAFIYFRGSNAKAGLRSVDADLVVYDEVDVLAEGTLALGAERLGSSLLGWQRYASTPIYPEVGIDALWLKSTRNRWHVTCPACNCEQALAFPDNLREDGTVICRACHATLPPAWESGRWDAENPGAEVVGYHVSKFLSPRANLAKLAETGYRILAYDETDATRVQEFWNQGCGVPHAPEGGQLSRSEIEACIADYSLSGPDRWTPKPSTRCTMGVDVGAKLHVRINAPSPDQQGKTRAAVIKTAGWEDLDGLMRQYDVHCCVIDAQPETHKAREFANRHAGRVYLCYYPDPATWTHKQPVVWNREERIVQAHRTITLDGLFAEVRERRVEYPREVLALPEFARQMMAPVRVIEKDGRGEQVGKYVEGGQADHYAHGANYERVARQRASSDPFPHVHLPNEVRT